MDLGYARGLLEAVPAIELARALARRYLVIRPSAAATSDERRHAAAALARAPRLLRADEAAALYPRCFPEAIARYRRRAERILARQPEIFGRAMRLGARIDWQRDLDLDGAGADPKPIWEVARAGHLVELAAASRLCPDLAPQARGEIRAQVESFLDDNPVGRGLHYRSPLEVAVRVIHWLAALEVAGGVAAFPAGFVERLARSLFAEGDFLSKNLEDRYVVCGNHLIGNLVGLGALGAALDVAAWRDAARRRLAVEVARQVHDDGAHFEASTGYHCFTLELLLVARRLTLVDGEPIARMLAFARAVVSPDGRDPGLGDSDDARVIPIVPRAPRDHSHLASLDGDGRLVEEALWWDGAAAEARAQRSPVSRRSLASRVASFPSGGVHVASSARWWVAMRAGPYGQNGVGGHAHNDQLALVVHLDGRALVVDPGTGAYTADPVARDRFRGTAAHATLVVDGEEQSPLVDRPFALPDRARGRIVFVEDRGERAVLEGEHRGYRRLRTRAVHRRRVTIDRTLELLLVEDSLEGRGAAAIELRFPIEGSARIGASSVTRARAAALPFELDLGCAVEILDGDRPRAALVPLAGAGLVPTIEPAWSAPDFSKIVISHLVSFAGRLSVPLTTAVLLMPGLTDGDG